MQPLSWWVQCLVLRNFPGPLLRRGEEEQQRARQRRSGEEAEPLREAAAGGIPRLPGRPVSAKACANGSFCVLAAVAVAVLIVVANLLCRSWPDSIHEQQWQRMYADGVDNASLSRHLERLTREPHVAGTPANFVTARYVESAFTASGLAAHHRDFDVLLTYPLRRSLALVARPGGPPVALALRERPVVGDPYSNDSRVVPPFHAYAPSGDVAGEAVYAHYGRPEDFRRLAALGVDVAGAVAVARYGKIYRGDIVANAAAAGAAAVVVYSDPRDYGGNGTAGYYPDAPWLPPSGAQRGSVFRGVGDPLTPGWPSGPGAERLAADDPAVGLPRIPSLPISAEDALPILRSLGGPAAPAEWRGALELPEYRVGRGPGRLNLSYVANQTVTPIRNVFATIPGSQEPDRFVLLGNHRDAWTFGAVDPNSGTAALLELARGLGKLVRRGWRPRRTIVLCSWDAEEYGLVGSTEWVEQNLDVLGANAVAYLNVDCAVAGGGFKAAASPQLDDLLLEVTKQVKDPDCAGQTLYDSWVASSKKPMPFIDRLGGGGSDFAAFLQHAGVPSMDLFFGDDYPVYHSMYDNYNWMTKFGDPLFHRHTAVTTLWGLLAMRLANDAILPLKYEAYADELQSYAVSLMTHLTSTRAPKSISIAPLLSAINDMRASAHQLTHELQAVADVGPKTQPAQMLGLLYRRRGLNDRLLRAERAFLDSDGIPGALWYKHLVYGPAATNNYGSLSFPGIWDAVYAAMAANSPGVSDTDKWAVVQHEIFRSASVTARASLVLRGKLT